MDSVTSNRWKPEKYFSANTNPHCNIENRDVLTEGKILLRKIQCINGLALSNVFPIIFIICSTGCMYCFISCCSEQEHTFIHVQMNVLA